MNDLQNSTKWNYQRPNLRLERNAKEASQEENKYAYSIEHDESRKKWKITWHSVQMQLLILLIRYCQKSFQQRHQTARTIDRNFSRKFNEFLSLSIFIFEFFVWENFMQFFSVRCLICIYINCFLWICKIQ
jgi:hypothetical protein